MTESIALYMVVGSLLGIGSGIYLVTRSWWRPWVCGSVLGGGHWYLSYSSFRRCLYCGHTLDAQQPR